MRSRDSKPVRNHCLFRTRATATVRGYVRILFGKLETVVGKDTKESALFAERIARENCGQKAAALSRVSPLTRLCRAKVATLRRAVKEGNEGGQYRQEDSACPLATSTESFVLARRDEEERHCSTNDQRVEKKEREGGVEKW